MARVVKPIAIIVESPDLVTCSREPRAHEQKACPASPPCIACHDCFLPKSAREEIPLTRECAKCGGDGIDHDAERESYVDPRCDCPDHYARCPVHGPKAPVWPAEFPCPDCEGRGYEFVDLAIVQGELVRLEADGRKWLAGQRKNANNTIVNDLRPLYRVLPHEESE